MKKNSDLSESFKKWIDSVSTKNDKGEYRSKVDGSYMHLEGVPWTGLYKFLHEHGVENFQSHSGQDDTTASIGFSVSEQKWYGWSHRAFYGFGVGSTVSPGNIGYMPPDKQEFMSDILRFWSDDDHLDIRGEETREDGVLGVRVSWTYSDSIPNMAIHGTTGGAFWAYPEEWGRGEWTAKTLEDAKQMAIDFAEDIS